MVTQLMEGAKGKWMAAVSLLFAAMLSLTLIPTDAAYATNCNVSGATTSVPVVMNWNDCDDQDGLRPDSVEVMLFADGELVDSMVISESDGWESAFKGLPKYAKDGYRTIVYTVYEEVPEGYMPLVTPGYVDGYIITNTHCPAMIEVSGTVTWDDADNQDGIRPDSVTVNLFNGDELVASQEVTADADGNWTYSFTDLPQYDKGVEIVYSIAEGAVEGYTATVDGHNLVLTHAPETNSLSVTVAWNDNGVISRPASVTVNLLADGEVIASQAVSSEGAWACAFASLPKYRDGGIEIVYSVTQNEVKGYTTEVSGSVKDGFVITNTAKEDVLSPTGDTVSYVQFAVAAFAFAISAALMAWKNYRRPAHLKK